MALAPDPVWQWLEDSGTRAAWEQTHNVRIEASNAFDQFAAFAGGHADVVLINALDVPKFVEEPGREPVIIGKYTTDRSILAVRRNSLAESLEDLVERRIAVESSLASTLLWGLTAELRYGLDFSQGGGADFDLVTVEPASVADLVMRGDVDACICTPDYSVPFLAERAVAVALRRQVGCGTLCLRESLWPGEGFARGVGALSPMRSLPTRRGTAPTGTRSTPCWASGRRA